MACQVRLDVLLELGLRNALPDLEHNICHWKFIAWCLLIRCPYHRNICNGIMREETAFYFYRRYLQTFVLDELL